MILVTGAAGFVGHAVCMELISRGRRVRAAVRSTAPMRPRSCQELLTIAVGDVNANTDWSAALKEVDCVIHCAARAHVHRESSANALEAYRTVNVAGTRRLAEQCVEFGVRRLVFVSSIGVLGVHTNGRGPFTQSDAPAPVENYAVSKLEAEHVLNKVAAGAPLEVVIVRPPLVYGPGAKGNIARLQQLVRRGLPLPLGSVDNKRSLVALDNLVDLLVGCVYPASVVGQSLLVSDGEDLSTPDLLRGMARAMRRQALLFPVPVQLLRVAGRLAGRRSEVERLVGSLQVDISRTRSILRWHPPVTIEEGLRRMVTRTGNDLSQH